MFHLKHPRFRGFFAWDELGCMSRALGFTVDLFKSHLIDDIQAEDNGLPVKEVIKMLDYKLLYKALHLTQNLHTEDWNTCVFRCCISILDRKALTFEDVYQARIAYQAYEAGDMKGMRIDEHILLRALKMCNKTISPMKLMHRVKHNSVLYDEPSRIQLYEFYDLLLWANGYEPYVPEKSFGHFEMEDSLFKLHDFDTLLTHHDKKLADKLDNKYLQEEWAFIKTKYASKSKLTDPAVISANRRSETEAISDYHRRTQERLVNNQKNEFRKLKNEVGSSQTVVYKAAQGCIRQRPITAPNLKMYDYRGIKQAQRRESKAVQSALNQKVQKLIKRSESKDANNNITFDMSDKPNVSDYKRCQTPKVVSPEEKEETDRRMEQLMFEMETEEGRYEIAMDTEMEHYIPDYKETYFKNKSIAQSAPHVPQKVKIRKPTPEKYDVSKMSHPIPKISPSHALRCDARQSISSLQNVFRGWYGVRSKKGPHYILMSPYFHDSPKGRLLRKVVKMSDTSVKKLHGDFIYRYTKRNEVDRRPVTAPAVMTADEYEIKRGRSKISKNTSVTSGYNSFDNYDDTSYVGDSFREEDSNASQQVDVLNLTSANKDVSDHQAVYNSNANISEDTDVSRNERDLDMSRDTFTTVETSLSDKVKLMKLTEPENCSAKDLRVKSAHKRKPDVLFDQELQLRSVSAYGDRQSLEELVPMPYMDHSKPKTVSVGSIGKISLLESISEAKYWEDAMKEKERERAAKNGEGENTLQVVIDGLDSQTDPESSHAVVVNDKCTRNTGEKGDSEILSIILKEEEMNGQNARADSAFSDRLTPHENSVVDGNRDISPECKSPSAISAKLENVSKDTNNSKKWLKNNGKTSERNALRTKHCEKKNKKKPEETDECVILTGDNSYMTDTEKYLRQLNEMLKVNLEKDKENTADQDKKHVVLKSARSVGSRKSSKSDVPRYERLLNRVKEEVTPKLARRILAGP